MLSWVPGADAEVLQTCKYNVPAVKEPDYPESKKKLDRRIPR